MPNIADEVKELHVFQRTPGWIPAREDYEYPLFFKVSQNCKHNKILNITYLVHM